MSEAGWFVLGPKRPPPELRAVRTPATCAETSYGLLARVYALVASRCPALRHMPEAGQPPLSSRRSPSENGVVKDRPPRIDVELHQGVSVLTSSPLQSSSADSSWWHRAKPYTRTEIICDGAVHGLGIAIAVTAGTSLLVMAAVRTAPQEVSSLSVYVGSLLAVLVVSLAFNMAPVTPLKRFLARLDQAAIFLLIAGTYTPMLALIAGSRAGSLMLAFVWGGALIGIGLKLFVPQHFGRLSLLLYGAIGWSGLIVFNDLARALPPSTMWLLLAGGVAYTSGIIFHVWQKLHFHNVLWHCFVVLGATLHLWAVLDCMVLRRL